MTLRDCEKKCFAWNSKIKCCRCLNGNYCTDGYGKDRNGVTCKFYKPRSDEVNNQKMKEFLKTSNKNYKNGKSSKKAIDKFTDGVLNVIGGKK